MKQPRSGPGRRTSELALKGVRGGGGAPRRSVARHGPGQACERKKKGFPDRESNPGRGARAAPGRRPRLRTSASSASRHRLRRLPQPCPDVPAVRSSAPHPRQPHAALAAPHARPPAAAARLWGALSPPCGSGALGCPPGSPTPCPRARCPPATRSAPRPAPPRPAPPARSARPPRPPPREARQPGSCPSRERGARGGQPPVRRSRLGWAEPARARAPGRQGRRGRAGGAGGRVDGGQDGPPRSPRASGRTGPGGGTREEKEEKEGPGGRRTFGQQRGGGARDQKRACLASPSGNRTPVSRVTGGDTHHYTNEDGGGGRPGARPLSAPATCPGPRPTRPDPPAAASARTAVPRPDSERRAPDPDPPPPPPSRTGMAAGEDARHGEQEAPRRGWAAAGGGGGGGGGGPDAGSRSPLEAWVRIPLLTRPPFGPPNAGSPHPGLDDALSVPPYTPLRAGGALAHVARDPTHAAAAPRPSRPRAAGRNADSPARAGPRSHLCPLRGAPRSPPRSPSPALPLRPPARPPARRERGVPTACPFRRPPFIPWSPPPAPAPGRPRGVATWRPHHGHTPATRAAEPSARQPETGPPPRSLGLARGAGARVSAPEAAAGPGLQDASALPHRAARQPAGGRSARAHLPASPPPQPSRPRRRAAGRAHTPVFGLLAWALLGGPGRRYRAPISDADTDDSVWRRPRPRERAQGEPSPPRGLAGTVGAARRPEPEPEPEPEPRPSAPLHGRGACLADRAGPPPAPAQRVLTTGGARATTSAAGEAVW
ncbi:basic proline-rich protein-like [Vulpes lagopus]|uniref:basic proline-rich protein-like n=1 Tax=Vulpes lagopus TaxID=494514 RepID=UPI001BCA095A|nr:basic proline-rich protein-like [Vulpes lagopus]